MPRSGDVVEVTSAASCQFAISFHFRITAVDVYGHTPTGWAWITGYVLNAHGVAVDRRELFVEVAGLIDATPPRPARRPVNTGPAAIPRQRTSTTARSTTR